MPLTTNQNPLGRGIDFFAQDKYFKIGTEVLGKTNNHLMTGLHAGTMIPLGIAYDATRKVVNAPVQLVGLVASLLPKKKVEEEKPAEKVEVEVMPESARPKTPQPKRKKPVTKKVVLDSLADLPEDLVQGTA
jgi:hypothetical protein